MLYKWSISFSPSETWENMFGIKCNFMFNRAKRKFEVTNNQRIKFGIVWERRREPDLFICFFRAFTNHKSFYLKGKNLSASLLLHPNSIFLAEFFFLWKTLCKITKRCQNTHMMRNKIERFSVNCAEGLRYSSEANNRTMRISMQTTADSKIHKLSLSLVHSKKHGLFYCKPRTSNRRGSRLRNKNK